jgi:hypothetical protein
VPSAIPVPSAGGTWIDNAIVLLLIVLFTGFGVWLFWRRARPVALYLAIYAALLVAWPWNLPRFLAPVVPLLIWVLAEGAFAIARRSRPLGILATGLGAVVLVTAASEDVRLTREARTCFRVGAIDSPHCFRAENRGLWQAAAFIRDSLPRSAVVVSAVEPLLAYQTDRRIVAAWSVGDRAPDSLLSHLRERGADYVLVSATRLTTEQPVRALTAACEQFRMVREFEAVTLLLQVGRDTVTRPDASACGALERYRIRTR